jgi:hypothetical protein
MKNKTIVGYYWDGTNHYTIYEDNHGNTKNGFGQK